MPALAMAMFIDGANLGRTAKALGFDIDFKRLLAEFATRGSLLRAHYYAIIPEDSAEYTAVRPLADWLDYNGITVVVKTAKPYEDAEGRKRLKRSFKVQLAV